MSRDEPVPALGPYLVGRVRTGNRSKELFVYAGTSDRASLSIAPPQLQPVPIRRLEAYPEPPLFILRLTGPQLNQLRAEYLSTGIIPGNAAFSFALCAGGRLIGACGFSDPTSRKKDDDVYLMADFAVACTVPKLSKLVLAAILSTQMRSILEECYVDRVRTITTTAFTDKPVSMKYRGLFELTKRGEGYLQYTAAAGKWPLEEAYRWWTQKFPLCLSA
jgi:hypothetical protein